MYYTIVLLRLYSPPIQGPIFDFCIVLIAKWIILVRRCAFKVLLFCSIEAIIALVIWILLDWFTV